MVLVDLLLMIVLHNQDVLQDSLFVLIKLVLLDMIRVKMKTKSDAHLTECSNVKIKLVSMLPMPVPPESLVLMLV
jgi:hypothetical protein